MPSGLPRWLNDKESACQAGDVGGSGRCSGERNGNPLQYSCLGKAHEQEKPGGLLSTGSQELGHNLASKQQVCPQYCSYYVEHIIVTIILYLKFLFLWASCMFFGSLNPPWSLPQHLIFSSWWQLLGYKIADLVSEFPWRPPSTGTEAGMGALGTCRSGLQASSEPGRRCE